MPNTVSHRSTANTTILCILQQPSLYFWGVCLAVFPSAWQTFCFICLVCTLKARTETVEYGMCIIIGPGYQNKFNYLRTFTKRTCKSAYASYRNLAGSYHNPGFSFDKYRTCMIFYFAECISVKIHRLFWKKINLNPYIWKMYFCSVLATCGL